MKYRIYRFENFGRKINGTNLYYTLQQVMSPMYDLLYKLDESRTCLILGPKSGAKNNFFR